VLLAPAYQALFHEETHAVAPKEWALVHGVEGRPELVHVAHAKEDPIVREWGPHRRRRHHHHHHHHHRPTAARACSIHASMLGLMYVPSARS
jgi:hypothetical protein